MMNRRKKYLLIAFFLLLITWLVVNNSKDTKQFSEIVKISLREAGNKLLLTNRDSTSLILPVIKVGELKYKLSFQSELFINPDSLVSVIKRSFNKSELPKKYRVEVLECKDKEVSYSYEIKENIGGSIIPCKGRILPVNCYTIEVRFIKEKRSFINRIPLFVGVLLVVFLLYEFLFKKKKEESNFNVKEDEFLLIGNFHFYSDQNKLVKKDLEIHLSKKECELLIIFANNPNEIVKREELTKRVWEDNGVIVGRSLDTYVSKLRKKLQSDSTIKLVNIHGVGYKLQLKK